MGFTVNFDRNVAVVLVSVDTDIEYHEEKPEDLTPAYTNNNSVILLTKEHTTIEQSYILSKFSDQTELIIEITYRTIITTGSNQKFDLKELNEINKKVIEEVTWGLCRSMLNTVSFQSKFDFPQLPLRPIHIGKIESMDTET